MNFCAYCLLIILTVIATVSWAASAPIMAGVAQVNATLPIGIPLAGESLPVFFFFFCFLNIFHFIARERQSTFTVSWVYFLNIQQNL